MLISNGIPFKKEGVLKVLWYHDNYCLSLIHGGKDCIKKYITMPHQKGWQAILKYVIALGNFLNHGIHN